MKYFFHYELPKIQGFAARLMEADGLTVENDQRSSKTDPSFG